MIGKRQKSEKSNPDLVSLNFKFSNAARPAKNTSNKSTSEHYLHTHDVPKIAYLNVMLSFKTQKLNFKIET